MFLICYGTRPEWIKVKPLIDIMISENLPFKTIFTGQHVNMVTEKADFNMVIQETSTNRLNSIVINSLNVPEECFDGIKYVIVQGDTTSALSLALNAFNRKIKVIHLEAGLRTYNFEHPYPEEMNRQLISRIANINLCPTTQNLENLKSEKVNGESFVVGNTGLDNLLKYKGKTTYENIVLITLHRRENHDKIDQWFKELNDLAIEYPSIQFILPIHPNPNVIKHKDILKNINVCDPLNHDELLELLIRCKIIITDSGGLQEECSFLNKKCLVCREITERPESIGLTTYMVKNVTDLKPLFNQVIFDYKLDVESPFGDGHASEKIIDIFKKLIYY